MIKIQVSNFDVQNKRKIKHAFLCGIKRLENLPNLIKENFVTSPFILTKQIHSSICNIVDEKTYQKKEGDAIITTVRNIALGICTADCVPILFADCENNVIGAAHVGWRGAKSVIIENTIAAMLRSGANITNLTAVIGPAIAQQNYEVGKLFWEAFLNEDKENKKFFLESEGTFFFNLISYVKAKLQKAGLAQGNIHDCGINTYTNWSVASYRRCTKHMLPNDSTNIALIMLKSDHYVKKISTESNQEWFDFSSDVKKICSNKILQEHTLKDFIENIDLDQDFGIDLYTRSEQNVNYIESSQEQQIMKKLRQGKIVIEKTLDLHGMTEKQAYYKLCNFIENSYSCSLRYLLVIVGKGKNGSGVIKNNFISWIESEARLANKVMMIKEALWQHGGNGAYYVFLRRDRSQNEVDFDIKLK